MTDLAKDAKAALAKLQPQLKTTKAQLQELSSLNDEQLKLAAKVQAVARSTKPPPAKGATIGDLRKAAGKLQELSRFSQTAAHYEQTVREVQTQLSPRGTQRAMLDDLCSMTKINLEQHTGGKGDDGGFRRDNKVDLHGAQGLQDSRKGFQVAETKAKALNKQKLQLLDKTPIADLDDITKTIKSEQKCVAELQRAHDQSADDVHDHGEALSDALSSVAS